MRKKRKLKKYKVSSTDSLCFAVSVVDRPAVDSNFMTFSEAKVQNFVAVEEQDRHMIYGCALRANYPIYRRDESGFEYLLEFDRNAIDEIVKKYFKMGFQNSWTEAHDEEVNGLTICESWIKESDTFDKSIQLGLDPNIECGSWLIGVYCENEDIWQKCKNGEYQGFSVEAMVSLEEFDKMIDNSEDKEKMETIEMLSEMDSKEFWTKLKDLIKDAFAKEEKEEEAPKVEEVEMEQQPTETIVETPTETVVEAPEEPIVTEVVEDTTKEEIAAPEPKEEPKVDAPINEDNHLQELLRNLTAEVQALKELNAGLTDKIKNLEHEPSVKPVNINSKPNAGDAYSQWRETMKNLIH